MKLGGLKRTFSSEFEIRHMVSFCFTFWSSFVEFCFYLTNYKKLFIKLVIKAYNGKNVCEQKWKRKI